MDYTKLRNVETEITRDWGSKHARLDKILANRREIFLQAERFWQKAQENHRIESDRIYAEMETKISKAEDEFYGTDDS